MVQLDMNTMDGSVQPGTYPAEVKSSQLKLASSGVNMIVLELVKVSDRSALATDRIMLGGKGGYIGKDKLVALGVAPDFAGDLDPYTLVGKQVWVALHNREYEDPKTGEKRSSISVDINQLRLKGMQPISEIPPGCEMPEETSDDVPF